MKLILVFPVFFLSGCMHYANVEEGKNGLPLHSADLEHFNDWKWEQEKGDINNIEHLSFKANYLHSQLEIMKIKGGLNCIPAQVKIAERYVKRFYSEYYNKLINDAQTTLIKLEKQNNKIRLMLEEIKYETSCLPDKDIYLTEINKKIKHIEQGGIFFEKDNSRLSKDSLRKVRQISYLLKDFEIEGAMIYGHSSDEGNVEYNYNLSKNRALSVKRVFEDEGFNYKNMIWRSYSKKIRNSENPEENRRVNIRVEDINIENMKKINKIKVDYRVKDWDIENY
jgi:outer membrane protein OmpA-like peptidoglycan-associated protein